MNSKLESKNTALSSIMLKNSGASLSLQSCSIFMPASSREEIDNRMLVSEAKAMTSLIGCNISAVSSQLSDGSITKVTGSLIGTPLRSVDSNAAFRVFHSGTKLFALGNNHSYAYNIIIFTAICHIFPASTTLAWPMLAAADEKTRVQLERVTIVGADDKNPNGVMNHETARVISKAVVLKSTPKF